MNKTAIKNFAIWARNKLRSEIAYKAGLLGISEKGIAEPLPQSTDDLQIFDIGTSQPVKLEGKTAIEQRRSLVAAIKAKQLPFAEAFDAVIEEVAYTWFNRLIAVRFMEVNDYLPSRMRVLSSDNPAKAEPDFVTSPFDTDIEFTDAEKDYIDELKDHSKSDELFQFIFIRQCNKLNKILPELFEKTNDYTELLLNVSFTDKDGIIWHLVHDIPEDDFNIEKEGQVEIIGWLYQYYNTEPKDKVFSRPSGQKIRKEDVPAATQLFTPDWIVRYMVENSLGRLVISGQWLVGSSGQSLVDSDKKLTTNTESEKNRIEVQKAFAEKMGWKYFLPDAEQTPEVQELITNHYSLSTTKSPEEISFLDPCMGSGHILVYAFDVFMQIYTSQGYTERDAAQKIVENNLYGLELDDRAAQLAYFAVMMKARSYDRRFLTLGIHPNLCSIKESNNINPDYLELFGELKATARKLYDEFIDAKEYGSILNLTITAEEIAQLEEKCSEIINEATVYDNIFDTIRQVGIRTDFPALIRQAKIMVSRYDVVCTNPPYMGGGFSPKLDAYIKKCYADYKSDLFSVFMIKCSQMAKPDGYLGFLTPYVWMFIQSYEKLRKYIYTNHTIETLIQFEYSAFKEATVPICTFALRNSCIDKNGCYLRLTDFRGGMEVQRQKTIEAIENDNCKYLYITSQTNFSNIPGSPVVYWLEESMYNLYRDGKYLSKRIKSQVGTTLGDNNKFMRLWYEVENKYGNKWFFSHKGGSYRKWYGNVMHIINWEKDGLAVKNNGRATVRSESTAFNSGISWTQLTAGKPSFRQKSKGSFIESASCMCFADNDNLQKYLIAFLNSVISERLLMALNPTMHFQTGDVGRLPFIIDTSRQKSIDTYVDLNIELCKEDWDSFETSWDFKRHPLVVNSGKWLVDRTNHSSLITNHYQEWENECNERFNKLKANEEELNRIFIDIYGLQDELTPEVEDKDVTVRKADLTREIKSLISYAVGCMFGRYSLDVDGLAYAGGDFSDKWVVVSGQYFMREVVEFYVGKELSRVDSMAKIYGFSDGDLRTCEASAEGGNVCTIRPDEEGSSFNSFQYRRGTVKKLYEGIRELSVNSKRIEFGTDNTAYDLCSPEILDAITSGNSNELVRRGWTDADRIDWKAIHYSLTTNHYSPDDDNCIPITDTKYFDDDIVGRFCEFIKVVYGRDTLEENLDYIAQALGNKGNSSREVIRNYFLNDFYKDHCKIYQKRPIYWLFDSGKQNGFKALIYIHRYNADTIGNLRVEYLHRVQRIYESEIEREQDTIDHTTNAREKKVAENRKEKLQRQLKETKEYDEKIAHLALSRIEIDLDDGVKTNYDKIQTGRDGKKLEVLGKI